LRVAFAGTPEFALPALAALARAHQLVGVLTPPDRPRGRGQKLTPSPVKAAALAQQLPLLQPATLKDVAVQAQLSAWQPQVLVVVAYGLLLPPAVLALPPLGCLNIHASLLPRWRGAAPIERAILAGDAETGVSIMQMDAGLDTGPVLLERRLPLLPTYTGGTLSAALAELGATALLEVLSGLAAGTLRAAAQPAVGASYAAKIRKAEARIDWQRSAAEIARQVRAFHPRPIAETLSNGEQLRVLEASEQGTERQSSGLDQSRMGEIMGVSGDNMLVSTGAGMLAVLRVQRAGRNPVSGREFAAGRLGQHLG
jgi:methionyl-tRNA formyltransferase